MGLVKRFVVAEESMLPTVAPGTRILAVRQGVFGLRLASVGEVVVFASPVNPEMWLVKRVAGVAGDIVEVEGRAWLVGTGEMFALSDNTSVTRADSRLFGPVSVKGSYRPIKMFPPTDSG